jgi:anti-sigma B factor antagonist
MSMARAFAVRCERRASGVVVVASGEIDVSSAPALRAALQSPQAQAANVVLDLRGVTFVDSSGLRVIVDEQKRSVNERYAFAVAVSGAAAVERVIDLTGLADVLDVVADPEERVAA